MMTLKQKPFNQSYLRLCVKMILVAALVMISACSSSGKRSPETKAEKTERLVTLNIQLGTGYMGEGRYDVALERLNKALSFDPKSAQAHTVIAVLYERIQKTELAETHYKKAVELDPQSGDANNNLGTFLCRQQKYDEANVHFKMAYENPFYKTPVIALTNAGSCSLKNQKPDLAEQYLRAALKQDISYPDALFLLAKIMHQSGRNLKSRAFLQRYESVARLSPDFLWLAYRVEYALNDNKASKGYAFKLKTQYPDSLQTRWLNEVTQQ